MSLLYLVLFTVVLPSVHPASLKRMSMERTHSQDLETSASGYIYTQASGQPTSYVEFNSNVQSVPQYQQYQHVVPVVQYYVAKPEVVAQEPEKLILAEEINNAEEEQVEDEPSADISEDGADKEEYSAGKGEEYSEGKGEEYSEGKGEEYEKSGGEEYQKAHHSAHGEKGDKGYDSKHAYSKGEKGKHFKEDHEGQYKENGGKKSGHHDSAGHYQQHHESGKGEKGEKHGEKSSHKKGQKTTGFHNVYHKDEYKKDHTFYDEADKSGFYKKHGDHEEHHAKENGGFKKGENHKSAHHADGYGKKGSHDKGHYDEQDSGFKGQKGHEEHHASFEDYAKDGGKKEGQQYGYENGEEKY